MSEVHDWVKPFCTRFLGAHGILDGFHHEYYLRFDCDYDPETPASDGACDVLLKAVGESSSEPIRLIANAKRQDIARLLFALKVVPNLPEPIKRNLYELANPLRAEA